MESSHMQPSQLFRQLLLILRKQSTSRSEQTRLITKFQMPKMQQTILQNINTISK